MVAAVGYAGDLISAPVLAGLKIGIDVSIAVGQCVHCACLQRGGSGSPRSCVEITSIPYANARPHHVDLVHCSAADQEAMAAAGARGPIIVCGSDHSRDVAVELAELRHCFDRSCPFGTLDVCAPPVRRERESRRSGARQALIAFVESIAAANNDRSTTASILICRSPSHGVCRRPARDPVAGKSGTDAFLKDCKLHLSEATSESHGRSTVSLSP
jgi:hypothetical protein